jgi:hypothetical protein
MALSLLSRERWIAAQLLLLLNSPTNQAIAFNTVLTSNFDLTFLLLVPPHIHCADPGHPTRGGLALAAEFVSTPVSKTHLSKMASTVPGAP